MLDDDSAHGVLRNNIWLSTTFGAWGLNPNSHERVADLRNNIEITESLLADPNNGDFSFSQPPSIGDSLSDLFTPGFSLGNIGPRFPIDNVVGGGGGLPIGRIISGGV